MNQDDESGNSIEVSDGSRKLKIRGYDLLTIFVCVCATLGGYLMYQHTMDSKEVSTKIAISIASLAQSQREMACIISLPQEQRLQEFGRPDGWCRRMSRDPMQ